MSKLRIAYIARGTFIHTFVTVGSFTPEQVLGVLLRWEVWLGSVLREGSRGEIRPAVCRMQAMFSGGGTY